MKRRDLIDFCVLLAREDTGMAWIDVAILADKLLRWGTSLSRLAVQDCNVGLDEEGLSRRDSLRAKVTKSCEEFKIVPVFSGDPRGATLKLKLPSGFSNDWGSTGVCVPTS